MEGVVDREGESEEDALKEENIRARVGAILADIHHTKPWELEWWSVYSANTLCLEDYRHGRVFFIGDSAHIVPIFGVRGLNNGLADAANIGWKLGWVLNGKAGEGLLDLPAAVGLDPVVVRGHRAVVAHP